MSVPVSGLKNFTELGKRAVQAPPRLPVSSWIQVLSHVDPQFGGIATSVPRLARATERNGLHSCPMVALCDSGELSAVPIGQQADFKIFSADRRRWLFDRGLRQQMRSLIGRANGVHIHGLWEAHFMVAAGIARDCGKPYVISAHGMLENWALKQKRFKKALYAALVEIRRMKRAACLRALSAAEVDDYRRLGIGKPIAIIPNGIDVPPIVSASFFLDRYPELKSKRLILFLGRLHEKKGLPLLLNAWSRISPKQPEAQLVIAGPGRDDVTANLQAQCSQLKIAHSVTFTGMLGNEFKWPALAAASAFILPSYSEGFSMAILEALAMGVPVIATKACNLPELGSEACGWEVDATIEGVTSGFQNFFGAGRLDLRDMGERGRRLVADRFHTAVVGAQLGELYNWLDGGSRPSSFEIA